MSMFKVTCIYVRSETDAATEGNHLYQDGVNLQCLETASASINGD